MLNKKGINVVLFILLLMVVSCSVGAQDVTRSPRINFNGITGDDFIGQAGLLYPFKNTEDSLWFTDFRYRMSSDDVDEWNLGLGYRKKLENYDNRLAGVYLFKDRRNEYDHNWDMWTVGGEILTDQWDFRVNGYLTDDETIDAPQNDEIIVKSQKLYYNEGFLSSMNGIDFEVGKRFVDRDNWLKNVGVYLKLFSFFEDNADTIYGHQLRIDKQFGDLNKTTWKLGAKWRDDDTRGSDTEATFAVSIPFGKSSDNEEIEDEKTSSQIIEARMTEQPERDLDIVVAESDDPDLKEAKNLDGSSLGDVIYVSAEGTGDGGSKSNPTNIVELNTLSGEGDIIIFMGDDGVIDPSMSEEFTNYTLKNGQKLLSASGKLMLSSEKMDKKTVFSPDVQQAVLSNSTTNSDVLVLADNTLVSGINFSDGYNIISGSDVAGKITITNNKFINGSRAIYLNNSGTADLDAVIKDNIIGPENGGSFGNGGIYLVNEGEGDTNLILSGNTLQRINYNAFQIINRYSETETPVINIDINNNKFNLIDDYGLDIYTDIPGTLNLTNNVFSTSEDSALNLYIESSDVKFKAVNNELNTIGDYGFDIYADGANNEFVIQGNKAKNIYDTIFELDLENADNGILTISNNQLETGYYSGIYLDDFDGTNLKLTFTENTIKWMDDEAVYLSDPDFNDSIVNISNNIISGNGDGALELDFYGDNNKFIVNNNEISNSYNGIELDLEGNGYDVEINNNLVSSISDYYGIYADFDGDDGKAVIDNNVISQVADDYGLYSDTDGDNNLTTISNNSLVGAAYGAYVDLNGTENELNLLSNNISDITDYALYLDSSGSINTVYLLDNNIKQGYESEGLYIYNSSSSSNFTIARNKVRDITSYELFYLYNSGADTTFDITDNVFANGPYDEGVYIRSNSASGVTEFNITGNTINNVNGHGLEFYISNSGDVIANIENNIISDNGDNGVYISGDETYTGVAEFMLSGNTIINNFADGIYVDLSSVVDLGGGSLNSTGNNLIYGNAGNQISNNSGSEMKAENNWWNQIPIDDLFSGDVDYSPYLEEEPVN